jgi:hypothetical protein
MLASPLAFHTIAFECSSLMKSLFYQVIVAMNLLVSLFCCVVVRGGRKCGVTGGQTDGQKYSRTKYCSQFQCVLVLLFCVNVRKLVVHRQQIECWNKMVECRQIYSPLPAIIKPSLCMRIEGYVT